MSLIGRTPRAKCTRPATNRLSRPLPGPNIFAMKSTVRIPGMRLLHSPGPTRVPDEVVNAMARQPTDLADARLPVLVAACESGMKALLQTDRAEVFFYAANGHGGWEAVIANLVAPGGAVLVPGTGHFSDGWAEQVEALRRRRRANAVPRGLPDRSGGRRGGAARRHRASHRRGLRRPHRHRERHDLRPRRDPRRDRRCAPSRRSSSSTSSPRSPRRRSRWTRSASTSPSARRRRA